MLPNFCHSIVLTHFCARIQHQLVQRQEVPDPLVPVCCAFKQAKNNIAHSHVTTACRSKVGVRSDAEHSNTGTGYTRSSPTPHTLMPSPTCPTWALIHSLFVSGRFTQVLQPVVRPVPVSTRYATAVCRNMLTITRLSAVPTWGRRRASRMPKGATNATSASCMCGGSGPIIVPMARVSCPIIAPMTRVRVRVRACARARARVRACACARRVLLAAGA
jgi:hypothetical protein